MCYKCVKYNIRNLIKDWWSKLKVFCRRPDHHPEYFDVGVLSALKPLWLAVNMARTKRLPISKGRMIKFSKYFPEGRIRKGGKHEQKT